MVFIAVLPGTKKPLLLVHLRQASKAREWPRVVGRVADMAGLRVFVKLLGIDRISFR